jgi:D-lactate dehydrogenase (cytochrome)
MLTAQATQALQALLEKNQLVTDPAELIVYEIDAAQDRGIPEGVAFPASSADLQRIARWANESQVALVGRGAGTGLSGGAVAERGGLIVEFSRMNHILEIDALGRSAMVEPGVINQALDEATKAIGLYYPPDPASGRSSTLGGNVAENAGGPHCFKYGVTTNYLTGLECVLANGRLVRFGGRAFDYPEYDFVRLLTGSEGTLGLVTKIDVRLLRNPPAVKTMMAAFDSVEGAGAAVSAVIAAGLVPAAMEMMDQKITRIIEDYAHPGLPTDAGALLIIDVDGYPASLGPQIAEVSTILQENGGYGLRIAENAAEREKIWFARKSAAGAMARLAPAFLLLDGTVPRSRLAAALEATNRICQAHNLKVGYVFHAGDGNLHPFILMYPADQEQVQRVYQAGKEFMQAVVSLGGSLTGEHGVGIEKRSYMPLMFNSAELSVMLEVKQIFDPAGRLNPRKIFPPLETTGSDGFTDPIGDPPFLHVDDPLLPAEMAPATAEDAARYLAGLRRLRHPVRFTGSHADPSQPAGESAFVLRTVSMNEIRAFAPQDLYVTAGAGMTLGALQASLAPQGMWVPADSPWPAASLGGMLAANLNAPLRMRYGSLSDQVLAMTVVLGDGRRLRLGRPVVKNVAGYDLARLMVGSFGTLGLIAEVTFKVAALPRLRRSLLVPVEDLEQGLAWGQRCLPLALVASSVLLARGLPVPPAVEAPAAQAPYWLTYTAEGLPEDVEAELELVCATLQADKAPAPVQVEAFAGTQLWRQLLGEASSAKIKIRCGVAPKDLAAYARSQAQALSQAGTKRETEFLGKTQSLETAPTMLLDFASGFVYAAADFKDLGEAQAWVDHLRQAALRMGGYTVVMEMPAEWDGRLERFGCSVAASFRPETLPLMRALKAQWDPAGILNPGAFIVDQD